MALSMWVSVIPSSEGLHGIKGGRWKNLPFLFFSASLPEVGHLISPSLALGLGFIPVAPLVLRPSILTVFHHWLSWVSTLQTADCGTSQPP